VGVSEEEMKVYTSIHICVYDHGEDSLYIHIYVHKFIYMRGH
jgi:DUF1680 family protein